MPVNRIKSVERTKIVVSGELPRQHVQEIFNQIVGPAPAVGFRYNYNKETDETEIRFVPCRVYTVDLPPEIEERSGDGISRERKIVIPGIIMGRDNIVNAPVQQAAPAGSEAKEQTGEEDDTEERRDFIHHRESGRKAGRKVRQKTKGTAWLPAEGCA